MGDPFEVDDGGVSGGRPLDVRRAPSQKPAANRDDHAARRSVRRDHMKEVAERFNHITGQLLDERGRPAADVTGDSSMTPWQVSP